LIEGTAAVSRLADRGRDAMGQVRTCRKLRRPVCSRSLVDGQKTCRQGFRIFT